MTKGRGGGGGTHDAEEGEGKTNEHGRSVNEIYTSRLCTYHIDD
jgi:hypothetical protein